MTATCRQWWVVPGLDGGESELRTVPRPEPEPGQVVVKVAGAAINRGELIGRPALSTSNPKARPIRSGIEFSGEVAAVGEGVTDWSVGQAVMGRGSGCHADYVSSDAAALMTVPAGLDLIEAACIPNVFVTAHDAMVTAAELTGGESVVISAGSSGVGTAALQIARFLGASPVVATTRGTSKADALRSLGADVVVDTTTESWVQQVRDATGGVDVLIDQVGGDLFAPLLETMALRGRYVSVGRNGGKDATIDLNWVALQQLRLIGVTFRTRSPEEALACSQAFVSDLLPAFDDGRLAPVLDRVFPLDELPAAHEYMRSDSQIGKIVLVP